ncbi:MAG: CGGC domain-containing protein [Thermodesulfobacteriota bacterium]
MEKLLIIGCKKAMDTVCVGCSRCLIAFNRRVGEFSGYRDQDAQLIGLASCGDCPGSTLVPRLAVMKLCDAPLGDEPTKIHLAPCLLNSCPHIDSISPKLDAKCGIEIVRGTHPYGIQRVFGE